MMIERAEVMPNNSTSLPSFKRPPVVEVILSLQFDAIQRFRVPQMGLLWADFRSQLPKTEERGTLPSDFERFDPGSIPMPSVRIETSDVPPLPRLWFLSKDGAELIQVQQDRFVNNWRKVDGESGVSKYPRFGYVFDMFKKRLSRFREFLSREGLGDIIPNQCEVTYINHIELEQGHEGHRRIAEALTVWRSEYTDKFLEEPEDVSFRIRYTIPDPTGKPVGRLHVSLQPAFRIGGQQPIYILNLTARGAPTGGDLESSYRFFELGHEWVVRGFASMTTHKMHQTWERE